MSETPSIFIGPALKQESLPRPLSVVPDQIAIRNLLAQVKRLSGLTQSEIAAKLGLTRQSIRSCLNTTKGPSLIWVTRFVAACGGRMQVELPGHEASSSGGRF